MSSEFYKQDAVDSSLFLPVLEVARAMPERKQEFDLPDAPEAVVDLGDHVSGVLEQPLNTAIIKRYNRRDLYISAAYAPHPDPPKFIGDMALISLDNEVRLFSIVDDEVQVATCTAGTMVLMGAGLLHWVTPPLEAQNPRRHFLFYGQDATKKHTG